MISTSDFGLGVSLRARQDVEGEGQQAVTGQNCGRLVEGFVSGGAPAAQRVVVHRRQVVVNERIAVHTLERSGDHQRLSARHAEQPGALD